MKVTTHMKTTSFLITAAVTLFACAATSQAAPAHARAKTARVNEVYCNEKTVHEEHLSATVPMVDETSLFRSRTELEMVNPG